MTVDTQLIETQGDWDQALQHCRSMNALAVDTEFIRRDTYFPKVGLIQLATVQQCFLLDPLAVGDLSGLAELLTDPGIVKVLHSCSEDLEVFSHALGVVPEPLFDTQIGAAYVGLAFSLGYQALVAEVLDVHLEKGETKSNWLRRPLSETQLEYAAQDVLYLLEIYRWVEAKLDVLGRSNWLVEDCQAMLSAAKNQGPPDYRRIKSAWKLSQVSLALLIELVAWRDREARKRNTPRSWLIKDDALLLISAAMPKTVDDLKQIQGISSKLADSCGQEITGLANKVAGLEQSALPSPMPRPLGTEQSKQLKRMKSIVKAWALDWQLPAEQLMKGKDFEAVQRWMSDSREVLPQGLVGWRMASVVEPLVAAMSED
jgi:ribonuclease D